VNKAVEIIPGKTPLWLLSIEHRHGIDSFIFLTEGEAKRALSEYVYQWWAEEMPENIALPLDEDEATRIYFEYVDAESATIQSTFLIADERPIIY
jgi:hypothetical protein